MPWGLTVRRVLPFCLAAVLAAGAAGCAGAPDETGGSSAPVADVNAHAGSEAIGAGTAGENELFEAESTGAQEEKQETGEETGMTTVTLDINGTTFTATLEDNATARELVARMPLALEMAELNGNEKYLYLDEDLPTAVERPGEIQAGDLMLYGSDCLVLFYESFPTSYSYTRIGHIDDASGLADAVGAGSVRVTITHDGA